MEPQYNPPVWILPTLPHSTQQVGIEESIENVYFIKHVFVYLFVYCNVFNKAKIHDDVLVSSCLKDRNEMVHFKVCGPFERDSK